MVSVPSVKMIAVSECSHYGDSARPSGQKNWRSDERRTDRHALGDGDRPWFHHSLTGMASESDRTA